MSLFAAWVLYPLVLLALCAGAGLLVDALCGRHLPGALVAPVGLAAIVVVGEFTTISEATASLTTPLVVVLALLGAGLSLRSWRFGRPDPWPAGAALGVFLVLGAPVILSGEPTFAGYVKLDDTATWLAITDRVMEHGRDLGGLAPSSYLATLEANLPGGYPVGAFIPFGAAQRIAGGDLAWVFQPYLSFLAAMLSLAIWEVLRVVRRPPLRAGAAFIAAQPALLYGYAMWGGVKEIAATAFVALAAALAPLALRARSSSDAMRSSVSAATHLRRSAPLALAAAALVGVLSLGGLVWVAPLVVALAVIGWRRLGERETARRALAFAAALLLFVAPTLIAGGFDPFQSGLTSESELGNLTGPLSGFQVVGIWPAGDFRSHPDASIVTAILVVVACAAALLGLWGAWRRRAERPLLYTTALLACAAIVAVGSPWVGGKALATAAPVALTLAALGALTALRLDRLVGAALIVAIAGGVIWSSVLAYGGVNLAPYGLLRELETIGHEFAGGGPTLMTEYNPYGARYFLREADGEGASELRGHQIPLSEGGEPEKGEAVDTDRIEPSALFRYRTLVLRRGPLLSRPPLPYRLVRRGDYYDVWQRPARSARASALLPLGDEASPTAVPNCGEIIALARRAHAAGAKRFTAARRARIVNATPGPFELQDPGRYTAWLGGSVRGSVALYLDGHKTGEARQRIENQGGFIELGTTGLSAGRHRAELRFGGADLHPGSGGFPRPATGPLLLTPAGAEVGSLVSVPLAQAARLCGHEWDWIEAAAR
jgi:hypothetical protein